MLHPRASELIEWLALEPHPEGGLYRRIHQSKLRVQPDDARGSRHALTAIYYLLVDGGISRWHPVASDEAWHWCEGAPLELFTATPTGGAIARAVLGPLTHDAAPQRIVPANHWQAARSSGAYTLVACCVAPGFEFADFTLLASLADVERPRLSPESLFVALL